MECGNDPLIHPGNCYDQPWVTVEPALNSAAELNAALVALKGAGVMGTTYASRVEKALISSWWVLLMRWEEACAFATREGVAWPLHSNMSVALAEWVAAAARQQDRQGLQRHPRLYCQPIIRRHLHRREGLPCLTEPEWYLK